MRSCVASQPPHWRLTRCQTRPAPPPAACLHNQSRWRGGVGARTTWSADQPCSAAGQALVASNRQGRQAAAGEGSRRQQARAAGSSQPHRSPQSSGGRCLPAPPPPGQTTCAGQADKCKPSWVTGGAAASGTSADQAADQASVCRGTAGQQHPQSTGPCWLQLHGRPALCSRTRATTGSRQQAAATCAGWWRAPCPAAGPTP